MDYAGPVMVKLGPVHKPVLRPFCYQSPSPQVSVQAYHLCIQLYIATLHQFIGCRGIPSTIHVWSDHRCWRGNEGNAAKEKLGFIVEFCVSHFVLQHAPDFVGLWEAVVKNFKKYISKILGEAMLKTLKVDRGMFKL